MVRFSGKDVPTDGINAAAKTVGDLALSVMTGMGQEIWPHPPRPLFRSAVAAGGRRRYTSALVKTPQANKRRLVRMLKVKARGNEPVDLMLRRFKKLCEKEGLIKEMKRISYYEKPSERHRRQLRKAQKRELKALLESGNAPPSLRGLLRMKRRRPMRPRRPSSI